MYISWFDRWTKCMSKLASSRAIGAMACSVVHHELDHGSRRCHGMYHIAYHGQMECPRVHSIGYVIEHSMGRHGESMYNRCRAGTHSSGMAVEELDVPHSKDTVRHERKHLLVRFLFCVCKVMPRVEHCLSSVPSHAIPILIFGVCSAFEAKQIPKY